MRIVAQEAIGLFEGRLSEVRTQIMSKARIAVKIRYPYEAAMPGYSEGRVPSLRVILWHLLCF
jgi:hypothetical protein